MTNTFLSAAGRVFTPDEMRQVRKVLEQRTVIGGGALDYLSRLDATGTDIVGSVSTTYGQAGIGVGLGMSIDFGPLVLPFFHVQAGLKGTGTVVQHSVVALERGPSLVYDRELLRPPAPELPATGRRAAPVPPRLPQPGAGGAPPLPHSSAPPLPPGPRRRRRRHARRRHRHSFVESGTHEWSSGRPVSLSVLRGRTWSMTGEVNASLWGGLASPLGTGIAAGAGVGGKVGYTRTVVRLGDPAPRHHGPRPRGTGLADDVDDLFEDHLKKAALGWIADQAGQRPLATKIVQELSPSERARVEGDEKTKAQVKDLVASTSDRLTAWEPRVEDTDVSWLSNAWPALENIFRSSKAFFSSLRGHPPTPRLIGRIESTQDDLRAIAVHGHRVDDNGDDHELSRTTVLGIEHRIRQGDALIAALRRRKDRDGERPADPGSFQLDQPDHHLDITTDVTTGELTAAAGARFLEVWRLSNLALVGKIQGRASDRRTSIRWQSRVDGHLRSMGRVAKPGAGFRTRHRPRTGMTVFTTRDTSVQDVRWELDASGRAGSNKGAATVVADNTSWYRSATASWYGSSESHGHESALANRSGVSIGVSIPHLQLDPYVRFCRSLPDGTSRVVPGEENATVERRLSAVLKVGTDDLRGFFRTFPYDLGDLDGYTNNAVVLERMRDADHEGATSTVSVLVEAAFAFTTDVQLPVEGNRVTSSLLDLDPVKERLDATQPDDPGGTRLQSLRVRRRVDDVRDDSWTVAKVGLSVDVISSDENETTRAAAKLLQIDETDETGVKMSGLGFLLAPKRALGDLITPFGLEVSAIRRGGAEGIVTIHEQLFPHPFADVGDVSAADAALAKHAQRMAEIVVPPVTLFQQ